MHKNKKHGCRKQVELDSSENNPNAHNQAPKCSNNQQNIYQKTTSNNHQHPKGKKCHELNGGVLNTVVMQGSRQKNPPRILPSKKARPRYVQRNPIFSKSQIDYEHNFPPLASKKIKPQYPKANPDTNKFDWSNFVLPKFEWHNIRVKSLKNPLHVESKEVDGSKKSPSAAPREAVFRKPVQQAHDTSDGFGWFIPL